MKPNRFKQVLQDGRVPVGHMIMEFATRGIAKILESAGVDFVVIDMEHTGFDAERIADLMAWFKASMDALNLLRNLSALSLLLKDSRMVKTRGKMMAILKRVMFRS